MKNEQKSKILNEIERETKRNFLLAKFSNFVDYFFRVRYGFDFKWEWYHHVMCEHVDMVVRGDMQYLVVNIPPRYSKTEIWSIFFPAFGYAINASSKFINVSYNQNLVLRNSAMVQDIINLDEFQELFPDTALKKRSTAKEEWENVKDGGFKAVSTGMGITGFGAGTINYTNAQGEYVFNGAIIIDDPLKPQDKDSDVTRPACIDYFRGTLLSRRNNEKVPIIIIMQRLHEDDLSGYCLSGDCGIKFHHLCLPAINEETQDVLWADKHSLADLQLLRKTMGEMEFAGQYMQRPAPAEGGLFKDSYWQYFSFKDNPMPFTNVVLVADTSEGETQHSDYSVFSVWAKHLNRAYLLDRIRVRADSEEQKDLFLSLWRKWTPRAAFIELHSTGTGLANFAKKQGIPVHGIKQHKSKVERANEIIEYIRTGFVYLNKDIEDLSDFLTEHRNFPNAKNDDQVDTTTLAVKVLLAGEGYMIYPEFSTQQNVVTKVYNNKLPLFVSFNTVYQPAYIIAQYHPNGQIVVLDSGVADDNKKEPIIQEAQNKQLLDYPGSQSNFRIMAFKKRNTDVNPFDWDSLLHQAYGMYPSGYEIFDKQNDIMDITAKFLQEVVINPETAEREARILIHPKNELLINALSGGVTFEIEERYGQVKPEKKIKEVYPYTNVLNAFHQFIYEVALARRKNNNANIKQEIQFRAVYN